MDNKQNKMGRILYILGMIILLFGLIGGIASLFFNILIGIVIIAGSIVSGFLFLGFAENLFILDDISSKMDK
jgi:hypothetical protein